MKSKVTLKEIVGAKIVLALLLVCYYWMWARRDWQDYYMTVQYVVFGFTVLFFAIRADRIRKYHKEEKDELAVQNLRRTDAISFKLMTVAVIVIAFACAVAFLDGPSAGYALVGMIFVLTVIRFVIFSVMDSRGI